MIISTINGSTNLELYGGYNGIGGSTGIGGTIIHSGAQCLQIDTQLKLPQTSGSVTFGSPIATRLYIDCNNCSTGIFIKGGITGTISSVSITNAVTGGQYVIYIQAAAGGITINSSGLTPVGATYTNKTNYTSNVVLAVNQEAIMTITTSGNTNFISCTQYL
jgi:hypothetical protein